MKWTSDQVNPFLKLTFEFIFLFEFLFQYVVPAFLVYFGRKTTQQAIGIGVVNHHGSWFKSTNWVIFVQCWALACVALVTYNHIANAVSK